VLLYGVLHPLPLCTNILLCLLVCLFSYCLYSILALSCGSIVAHSLADPVLSPAKAHVVGPRAADSSACNPPTPRRCLPFSTAENRALHHRPAWSRYERLQILESSLSRAQLSALAGCLVRIRTSAFNLMAQKADRPRKAFFERTARAGCLLRLSLTVSLYSLRTWRFQTR
jgi:hypothetical protein